MGANELTGSAVAAYLCAEILQWVKHHPKIALLQLNEKRLNRYVSILVAGITSIGVNVGFDANAGTLTVSGLLAGSIVSHIGEWVRQWVFQQVMYRTAIQPNQRAEDGM